MLHVHGFADYFFQTAYAEWWTARGYDFYALDLRKYGRSLRPHQTPNYVADLREYFAELDAAWYRITERDGHDHVVAQRPLHRRADRAAVGQRSGGRPLGGMVLNSPWFDMHGLVAAARSSAGRRSCSSAPASRSGWIPRTSPASTPAACTSTTTASGTFDLALEADHVLPGLRRLAAGDPARARGLHAGLDIGCPALVLSSGGSALPTEMGEDVHGHDIVLDVDQIRRWAPALGRHVTYVGIEGARHDVVLSRPDVRKRVYDELERWLTAYVD